MKHSNNEIKEELRKYYKHIKGCLSEREVSFWLSLVNQKQKKIIDDFDINKIVIRDYDLPFPKLKLINNISSFYYKGRVGRRIDKIVYYDTIPLGYIQLSSPLLNTKIHNYLKEKYGKYDFTLLNDKVVELSICIPFGIISQYLGGKLLVFIAMSKEIIEDYNKKFNTNIEVLFTTSIFGKSSMYNRIRNLKFLGLTEGYHSILTDEQIKEIKELYKKHYPHREIKKTAKAEHIIRLYLHLLNDGIKLSFDIPKLQKGVYVCDIFLPLEQNLLYWFNRWFVPRRERLKD